MIYPFISKEATKKYDEDKQFLLDKLKREKEEAEKNNKCRTCNLNLTNFDGNLCRLCSKY